MKNFILFLTIFAFIVEPFAFMPRAEASAAQCRQGPEKTKEGCSQNPKLEAGMKNKDLGENGQKNKQSKEALTQAQDFLNLGEGLLSSAKQECTEAGETCMSSCDQEIGRKKAMVPPQDTSFEEQAKQECKKEKEESEAKSEGGLKEIMALLQALIGLIAALKGNKEDEPKTEEAKAEEEEEDICKTPEGAFLVNCQCDESEKTADGKCPIQPKNTASRLGGSTGILAGGGATNGLQARPASAEFESKLQDGGAVGSASAGGGSGGSTGFGSGSTPNLNGAGGSAADPSLNADIHKGFLGGGGGGGGGGFGSFGGGGGAKSGNGYKGFGSSSSGGNKAAKKSLNKKIKSAASRRPASFNGGRTGGPFGDNFYTIKKAYKKQKASMYEHNQQ